MKAIFSLIFLLALNCAIGQPADIVQLEYYFDSDPGFGNGTSVFVSSGAITNTTFNIDISGLSPGIHYVYFRALNANGDWSHVYKSIVTKIETTTIASAPNMTEAEYYVGEDPGYGNGTPISFTSDPTPIAGFNLNLTGLDAGYHKVYFRFKDENNRWSHDYIKNITVVELIPPEAAPEIVDMEYFIDTDPGYGNGITVPVTSGKVIETTFAADISGLDAGYHKVYIRTQDSYGRWSLSHISNIVKVILSLPEAIAEMTTIEYFIDTDPGIGNGTAVSISPVGVLDFTFEADLSGVSSGDHDLYVRIVDENGSWSMTHLLPFTVSEVELNAFLEGPYGTAQMQTDLNSSGYLPLDQPYSEEPWNYTGSESVASIPNANVVDWILLETRHAQDAGIAATSNYTSRQAVFLLDDGSIVDLDGSSNLQLNCGNTATNFVVLRHRNHIGVLSAQPLNYDGSSFNYDFTTSAGQAYGSNQKDLGSGIFGLFAGNANGDNTIDESDLYDKWDIETGNLGYFNGDMNMNTQVNNGDKNEIWLPNLGSISFENFQETTKIKILEK
jgi:hypothetical protein